MILKCREKLIKNQSYPMLLPHQKKNPINNNPSSINIPILFQSGRKEKQIFISPCQEVKKKENFVFDRCIFAPHHDMTHDVIHQKNACTHQTTIPQHYHHHHRHHHRFFFLFISPLNHSNIIYRENVRSILLMIFKRNKKYPILPVVVMVVLFCSAAWLFKTSPVNITISQGL